MRNAVFNAIYNAERKRGKPFRELWRKSQPIDPATVADSFRIIEEIEAQDKDRSWVDQIYRANGLEPPRR